MGQDKGLVPFMGKTLVERVIDRVQPIADELIITTNNPDGYNFLGLPLFPDKIPGRGALGGLYSALDAASQSQVAVIACDMAFVSCALISAEIDLMLQHDADLVIPYTGDGLEPFHALYRRDTCLPEIKATINADKWRVDAWFSGVNLVRIEPDQIRRYDSEMLCFYNINTPADLREAELIASSASVSPDTLRE